MHRAAALALALTVAAATAVAQSAPTRPRKPRPAPASKADRAIEDEARQRRENAMFLLTALADEAAKFADVTLRARVQARVADLVWPGDRDRGAGLFRRAWDAAQLAHDREVQAAEERRARGEREPTVRFGGDIREEVLRLATRRDRALGEALLAKLTGDREREADKARRAPAKAADDPFAAPNDALEQRIRLASSLLAAGEVEKAIEIAEPALTVPFVAAVEFLTTLREKQAAVADARYAALLARAAADPSADAQTVSILSSYAYTPHRYVMFTRNGTFISMTVGHTERAAVPHEVKTSFLAAATRILRRPLTPDEIDQTAAGRTGLLLVIARLLPLAEADAPDLAQQLRARMVSLDVQNAERIRADNAYALATETDDDERSEAAPTPARHTFALDDAVGQAALLPKGDARDLAYSELAMTATGNDDARSREFADAVDDPDRRRSVRGFVDFQLTRRAIDKNAPEEAVFLVRSGEMPAVHKAWLLCGAARLFAKTDKDRARETLAEATDLARHIDLDDADRPRALFAVATTCVEIAADRVEELASEAVRAANRTPEFTGQDGGISIVIEGGSASFGQDVPDFDVDRVFAHLAARDLVGATTLAKSFTGETPRSIAILVIGESVLAATARQRP